MNSAGRIVVPIVAVALVAIAVWWFVFRPIPASTSQAAVQPPAADVVPVSSFDEFNEDLAKRAAAKLADGGAKDFQIIVTAVADPIGTLYRKGRSVPVNDTACAPAQRPQPRSLPNAFPGYTLDAKVAAEAGLNPSLLQEVGLGANANSMSSVSFSIIDPRAQRLTDDAMAEILRSAACTAAVKQEMLIVRGYVVGQRKFVTSAARTGAVNAAAAKVGNMKVDLSNAGVVTISDETPQEFLQILSEVSPAAAQPSTPAQPPAAPSVGAPKPVSGEGRIYVQQPRSGNAQEGLDTVAALHTAGFGVESAVERTADNLTPSRPQVRYFNEDDRAQADRVLQVFRARYANAELVRLKMQAPRGQLEVWLPREAAR